MSPALGPIASTANWITAELEGQKLIAIPRLRVRHEASLGIAANVGLSTLFAGCTIITAEWQDIAGFVGGQWMLWKTGSPDLVKAGFVRGQVKFDIERAVRNITKLLE